MSDILKIFTDPYERKARVFPGLLVALPLLVPMLWIFGPKSPYLTALLSLIVSCGAIYWLASVSRTKGKALEEKLIGEWGGMPTTLILRHRDKFLDVHTKTRYHSEITSKLGIKLPTPQQENLDEGLADEAYIGSARRLRELTRSSANSLLLKENIAYGFHRNMLAMRPVGIATASLGILFGLVLSKVVQLGTWSLNTSNLAEPGLAGGITLFTSTILLVAWSSVNKTAVRQMGYVYAERLFECLPSLPKKRLLKAEADLGAGL